MIRIICDFERTDRNIADYSIESSEDYIIVRQSIQKFLDRGNTDESLTILVRHPVVASWLQDLRDYGTNLVDWQMTSIRQLFQEHFGIPMPTTLSSEFITEYPILDWLKSWIIPENIEGSVLQRIVSVVWFPDEPSNSHFIEFVKWSLSAEPFAQLFIPLMQLKLTRWQSVDSRYEIFESIASLRDRSTQLLARWYFREYPEKFRSETGLGDIREIEIESNNPSQVLSRYSSPLAQYWSYRFAEIDNPKEAVEEALRVMSGYTEAELQELCDYVVQHSEIIDLHLIRSIQSKFATTPSLENEISRLKAVTPPQVPPTPEENATRDEMLNWVQDKYIPYFIWIIRNGYKRTEQIRLSDHFAEWLYSEYSACIYDAHSPLVSNQFRQFEELVSLNHLVLWVIVDGMTWWEGTQLVRLANDLNLSAVNMFSHIAALPSITSVSKRAMVRGYLDTSAQPGSSNAQIAVEELKQRYGSAFADTNVNTVQSAIQKANSGVFLWFYNELDSHHHKSDELAYEVVEGHLKQVLQGIDKISYGCQRRGVGLSIFVSSDHGCTRLPDNAQRLELPKFAAEWDADEPYLDASATRACSVDKNISSMSLSTLASEWFVLHKDNFSLPINFIVPKGYNYVGRRPRGWTHGGLSPEEVVVPFIQLQAGIVTILEPRIEIIGSIRSNFASPVKVEVTNPNNFELRNLNITIQWGEALIIDFGTVPAKRRLEQSVQLVAKTVNNKEVSLNYLLSYDVHGQEQIAKGAAKLRVRRLMVSAIDDMFEE